MPWVLGIKWGEAFSYHWPLWVNCRLSVTESCWDWTDQTLHPALPLCLPPAAPSFQTSSSLLQEESCGAEMLEGTSAPCLHVPPLQAGWGRSCISWAACSILASPADVSAWAWLAVEVSALKTETGRRGSSQVKPVYILPFLSCANWGGTGGAYFKWRGEWAPIWDLCCAKELDLSDMPADNASLELPPAAEATRLESKAELLCPPCWWMRQDEQGGRGWYAILWSWCLLLPLVLFSASMLIWLYLKVYFQKKLLCTTWWIFFGVGF